MAELVYLNGSLVPRPEARVSATDRGLLYGDGLFETMRIEAGRALYLQEHLARLAAGAQFLQIPSLPPGDLWQAVALTIAANDVAEGSLRLTLTRGEGTGPDPVAEAGPTLVINVRSGLPYRKEQYLNGFRVRLASFRRDSSSPLCRVKSLNFLPNVLARREAKAAGGDEGLFLNGEGNLCEGAVSNLFLREKGRLITPPEDSGILPGITRRMVMDTARGAGHEVLEEEITPARLGQAEEAFLTNSLLEIMPLVAVDERPVGRGVPGPLTGRLMELYRLRKGAARR